jgi:flagellar hook-associated protein 2
VGDLITAVQAAFGATATVSLNASGELEVLDAAGGATPMALTLSLIDDGSGSKLGLGAAVAKSSFKNVVAEGKKAFYLMNEMSVSSQTNRDNNTVTGTVFELKRADTTQNVKLTLDFDKEGIQKKVQGYLDTYNQLIKFLDEKSKIEVTKSDNKTGSAAQQGKTKINKGPFAGDSSILGLKSQLQSMMTNKISELSDNGVSKFSSLASLGITSEQKTGFLQINSDTFGAALDADFEGVKRVFVTGGYMTNSSHVFGTYTKNTRTGVYDIDPAGAMLDTDKTSGTSWAAATVSGDGDLLNSTSGDSDGMALKAAPGSGIGKVVFVRGVAGQIKDFYDKITNFVDGFVTTTAKGYADRIKDEDTKISRLEAQVASVKERLTKQFANLELSVSKLKSQSAAFSNALGR